MERLVSNTPVDDEVGKTLDRAKIVTEGIITPEHSWLAPRVEGWRNTQASSSSNPTIPNTNPRPPVYLPEKKKKVLLLGSGLVAGPAVDVFVARGDVELIIGERITKLSDRSDGFSEQQCPGGSCAGGIT